MSKRIVQDSNGIREERTTWHCHCGIALLLKMNGDRTEFRCPAHGLIGFSRTEVLPYEPPCAHWHIDNATWLCKACGEKMIGRTATADTVMSAPNAAAGLCTIIDCDGGPGCTAVYVPDYRRAQRITAGYNVAYECERCCITRDGTVWDCGKSHQGDYIHAK